jgi:hypothetical protein
VRQAENPRRYWFSGRIAGLAADIVRLRTDSANGRLVSYLFFTEEEAIMQSTIERKRSGAGQRSVVLLGLSACAVGAMLVAGMAAAAGGNLAEAQARYKQDRAACISGQSYQDRATCLREAGAALQAAKRRDLGDDQSSYEQNLLRRCEPLPAGEREDCVRRMHGEGTVKGSVEGGGTYRELRTIVPAQ